MTALELCDRAELNGEARQLATPDMPARTYIEQLTLAGHVRAAIGGLAQSLPKVEAIAWGLGSIRLVEAAVAKAGSGPVIECVERWLAEPNEERRRAAKQAADKAGIATPAGCLGLAVFFSGGSIAPAEAPVSPEPAQNVCGKMVAGAMGMAVAHDPQNAPKHLRAFLDRGMRTADKLKIWEKEG